MRRNTLVVLVLGVVLTAALAFSAAPEPPSKHPSPQAALDGKTFDITLMKESGDKEGPDQLIFSGGTLDSTECRKYGFDKAPYSTTKREGGAIDFESSAKSDKEGSNHWSGTVQGNDISGTLKWTKEGSTTTYTFKGSVHV